MVERLTQLQKEILPNRTSGEFAYNRTKNGIEINHGIEKFQKIKLFYPYPSLANNLQNEDGNIFLEKLNNIDYLVFPTISDKDQFITFVDEIYSENAKDTYQTHGAISALRKINLQSQMSRTLIHPFFVSSEFDKENLSKIKQTVLKNDSFDMGDLGVNFYTVGRLSRNSNVDSIIKSFSELQGKNSLASLFIWGTENDNQEYVEKIKNELKENELVNSRVRIFSGINDNEVSCIAAACGDVFINMSSRPTYNTHLYEAIYAGKPVIANRKREMQDLTPNGYLGVNDFFEPYKLSSRMNEILKKDVYQGLSFSNLIKARDLTKEAFENYIAQNIRS